MVSQGFPLCSTPLRKSSARCRPEHDQFATLATFPLCSTPLKKSSPAAAEIDEDASWEQDDTLVLDAEDLTDCSLLLGHDSEWEAFKNGDSKQDLLDFKLRYAKPTTTTVVEDSTLVLDVADLSECYDLMGYDASWEAFKNGSSQADPVAKDDTLVLDVDGLSECYDLMGYDASWEAFKNGSTDLLDKDTTLVLDVADLSECYDLMGYDASWEAFKNGSSQADPVAKDDDTLVLNVEDLTQCSMLMDYDASWEAFKNGSSKQDMLDLKKTLKTEVVVEAVAKVSVVAPVVSENKASSAPVVQSLGKAALEGEGKASMMRLRAALDDESKPKMQRLLGFWKAVEQSRS